MLASKTRYVDATQALQYIKDCTDRDVKDLSGEEVMGYLFGCYNNDWQSDLRIVDDEYEIKQTMSHRLNKLWAYPFTLVIASPYRYIRYGSVGWNDKTPFGKWILTICGER